MFHAHRLPCSAARSARRWHVGRALRGGGQLGVRLALLLSLTVPVASAQRALLVGVSEYPTLPPALQLHGPRNDVVQMRRLLLERGFTAAAIESLADGVPGAALPTRANITSALDRLATGARSGEQVVIYFAGHGSQQPVPAQSPWAAAEPDGLFEVFLPRDVGPWEPLPGGRGGEIRNALVDHEIRQSVDRISARGASVWAIFDTCHAATLVRGAADAGDAALRRVPPGVLGVPEPSQAVASSKRTNAAAAADAPGPSLPAGVAVAPAVAPAAYFYAAQTSESAPEQRLPPRHRDAVVHGLFTYTLLQALAGGGGMSYRQLAQAVLLRYAASAEGAGLTPVFSGTGLDGPVLGQHAPPVRQWPLVHEEGGFVLAAGTLSDLHPGALLAVLPSSTSSASATLGHLEVREAGAHRATLAPVAYAGQPAAEQAYLARGAVARLVSAAPPRRVAVHADLTACTAPCSYRAALMQLAAQAHLGLDAARSADLPSLDWVSDGSAADLRLVAVDDILWLLPGSFTTRPCRAGNAAERSACVARMSRSAPALQMAAGASTEHVLAAITSSVGSAARALGVLRAAAALTAAPPGPLETEATLVPRGLPGDIYLEGTVPDLASGDAVQLRLHNRGRVGMDVTVLLLDSRFGIEVLYPAPGAVNRVEAGGEVALTVQLDAKRVAGIQRLVVIATAARPHQERADFSALAQASQDPLTLVRRAPLGQERAQMRVINWRLRDNALPR